MHIMLSSCSFSLFFMFILYTAKYFLFLRDVIKVGALVINTVGVVVALDNVFFFLFDFGVLLGGKTY